MPGFGEMKLQGTDKKKNMLSKAVLPKVIIPFFEQIGFRMT